MTGDWPSARRTREATRPGLVRECSHMRTTVQPRCFSSRVIRRSRRRFRSIFGIQYASLLCGMRKHRGQWCQKQPSTKSATRSRRKTKSGLPGRSGCRRQPVMPSARRIWTKRCSVDAFPLERMRDIAYERCSGVRSSTTTPVSTEMRHVRPPGARRKRNA